MLKYRADPLDVTPLIELAKRLLSVSYQQSITPLVRILISTYQSLSSL
jgi:hypothetical protein